MLNKVSIAVLLFATSYAVEVEAEHGRDKIDKMKRFEE